MDRRSFFKALAGAVVLPSAAIPVVETGLMNVSLLSLEERLKLGRSTGTVDGVTLHRVNAVGPYTIGQYADYASMQWDVGHGYLDLGDIPYKKMGRLR
jgi:hypothetical protein